MHRRTRYLEHGRQINVRLLRYPSPTGPRLAVVRGTDFVDVALAFADQLRQVGHFSPSLANDVAQSIFPQDLAVIFGLGKTAVARAAEVLEYLDSCAEEHLQELKLSGTIRDLAGAPLLPPLGRDSRVFCVGLNYLAHVAEGGREPDTIPSIFTRTHASFVGHNQVIVRPRVSIELDWEGEFTAIIGKAGRYIAKDEALEHVAGYTITNEGSVRDYQHMTRHLTPGKNFDRSGSMGPWIQTADGVADPQAVDTTTVINGETLQKSNTADQVFDLRTLISFISEFAALQPGDCITTGSPSGVGAHRSPPRWLEPGDVVRFTADGVGELDNVIGDDERE